MVTPLDVRRVSTENVLPGQLTDKKDLQQKISQNLPVTNIQQAPNLRFRANDHRQLTQAKAPIHSSTNTLTIHDLAKGNYVKQANTANIPQNKTKSNLEPTKLNLNAELEAQDDDFNSFAPTHAAESNEILKSETAKSSVSKRATQEIANKFFEAACFAEFNPLAEKTANHQFLFKPQTANSTALLNVNATNSDDKLKADLSYKLQTLGFKHSSNGMFYNVETGTSFIVIIKDKKISACFGGLGSEGNIIEEKKNSLQMTLLLARMAKANMTAATRDFLGGVPKAAKEAMQLGAVLKDISADAQYETVVIGHSHGGGLAACAASAAGIQGVLFNARPLGVGVRREIEKFKATNPPKEQSTITAFVTDNDWVAHKSGILHKIASIFKKEKRPTSIAHETWELSEPPSNEKFIAKSMSNHNEIARPLLSLMHPGNEKKIYREVYS